MDAADGSKSIGMYGWVGIADDNPNPINWSVSISFQANGLIPSRELGSSGVGHFYTGLSSDFKDLISVLPGPLSLSDVQGFEACYKFGLTKCLNVMVDLQVVLLSVEGANIAVIAGATTKLKF